MLPMKKPIKAGDIIEVTFEVTIRGGIGEVTLFQQLPLDFELVEGNNFRSCWKGREDKVFVFSYKVRCPKRGKYSLGELSWESKHVFGLTRTVSGSAPGTSSDITVKPRIMNVRMIRGRPGIASSSSPVIDIAKIGVATTDFREIRKYVHGDPVRTINWKATARHAAKGGLQPLVNEYEVEGKKAVWIFLDASASLELGTTVENAFEYCLEAASGVAFYYIDRGYKVGMYTYHGGKRLVPLDAGKRQYHKLVEEIIDARAFVTFEPSHLRKDGLSQAVDRCKRYILGYNPLCIIITSLDDQSSDSLIKGVKRIVMLRGRMRRKLPVMVIGIDGHSLIPQAGEYEANAVDLLRLETRPTVRTLRALGSSVLEWNPRQQSLGTVLLRQVRTR